MELTREQVDAIRATLDQAEPNVQEASVRFYDTLFDIAPEIRPMFRDDLSGQGMKFMTTLRLIVDRLDDPGHLADMLHELAQGHRAFGVRPSHFTPMGEALIRTLAATPGVEMTPQAETAWRAAYALFATAMIEDAA